MNVAFYAPLKPPDAVNPSGDRRMARALMAALAAAGARVSLASRLRSFDRFGDARRQSRLRALGQRLAARYVARIRRLGHGERPRVWFTYHLYHKAPDWLGPEVSRALAIPYVVAEASYAPKQAGGRWAAGHERVAEALSAAAAVLALNPGDNGCVAPLLKPGVRIVDLAPFLEAPPAAGTSSRTALRAELAARYGIRPQLPWLLAVGMLRDGDKLASYLELAAVMQALHGRDCHLFVAGDGEARAAVQSAFAGNRNVTWLGRLDARALADWYLAADLFVWPAVREAFGMAVLEAQAAGLPVVAGFTPGLAGIVNDGETGLLARPSDPAGLAARVCELIADPDRRARMGSAARDKAQRLHSLEHAADVIRGVLDSVIGGAGEAG